MVRTRRQALDTTRAEISYRNSPEDTFVKKEEEHEEKFKFERRLHTESASPIHHVNNNNRNETETTTQRVRLPSIVFRSESTAHKIALAAPPPKIDPPTRRSTHEQIQKMIGLIVNEKMTIAGAARKVRLRPSAGYRFYKKYMKDPEHRIPIPNQLSRPVGKCYKQEQINQLIGYIVNDKMDIAAAAKKADMTEKSGSDYYQRYLDDPEHQIPMAFKAGMRYSDEQIKEMFDLILNQKYSINSAARKVKIGFSAAYSYHRKYMKDPKRRIPTNREAELRSNKYFTTQKVKQLIHYIVKEKLNVAAASRKVELNEAKGLSFYTKYLEDPERKIPEVAAPNKTCTQEQVDKLIHYIVNEKKSVAETSKKVDLSAGTVYKYYKKYLADPERKIPVPSLRISIYTKRERVKELFNLILTKKMSLEDAANQTKLGLRDANEYYRRYLNDPEHKIPIPGLSLQPDSFYTPEKIKELINYIVKDKMSIAKASENANMTTYNATKFFYKYMNEWGRKVPETISIRADRRKLRDEHNKFILGLYKEDPYLNQVEVTKRVNARFPDLKVSKYNIYEAVHNEIPEIKEIRAAAGLDGFQYNWTLKMKAKHYAFLKELYKDDPEMPVSYANSQLSDAFPGFSISNAHLTKYLRYKLGIDMRKKTTKKRKQSDVKKEA